ncbi:MAG: hypothetical protein ACKODB_01580 [Betaproteobacteria bacterium]
MKIGWGLVIFGLGTTAFGQVPDEVRARLGRDGVVITESWVFASATGAMRGSREADEHRQATRAMAAIARSLCKFEPAPGKRLEAGVSGYTMVSSIQRGREMEVVMRAPTQTAVCRVQVIEIKPEVAEASGNSLLPNERPAAEPDAATQLLRPDYIREKNMTIRVLNREY